MFLGLRTAIYYVDDIAKGRDWYSALLGFAPYFDEPFYVGFNVGGYELGLQPTEASATDKAAGVVTYWGVENAEAALKTHGSLSIRNPHMAMTDRAFERTPAARLGNRPVNEEELVSYRQWQQSENRKVSDRSALLLLGIR